MANNGSGYFNYLVVLAEIYDNSFDGGIVVFYNLVYRYLFGRYGTGTIGYSKKYGHHERKTQLQKGTGTKKDIKNQNIVNTQLSRYLSNASLFNNTRTSEKKIEELEIGNFLFITGN